MLSDGTNVVFPVGPANGNGFGGGFGGDGWWILLFFFAMFGGWGNGFGGGYGGADVLPYMWNTQTQNDVNRGFDSLGLSTQLTGIQSAITNGFATSEVSNCNRAMDSMQTAYTNQIASMNQRFADSTALTAQLSGLSAQLASCCCDNKSATEGLRYTIATEACADRNAISNALKDVLAANNASTQRILDQMCQDRIDAKNEKIAELERQLTMANLSASQTAQTAQLIADNARQTTTLEQLLAPAAMTALFTPHTA